MARFIFTTIPLALIALAAACSGSDSTPPGSGGPGGPTGDAGPGGPGAEGGTTDTGVPPPDLDAAPGASCPARTSATQAVHVMLDVTWPGTVGTNPGSGKVNVWTRSKLTFDKNNNITAVNQACGSVVPEVQTTPIAGGAKVLPEFPGAVWDSPSMSTFPDTGSQTSFDVNSKVNMEASQALVGLTMADPNGAWPSLGQVQSTDSDGDSHPGITSVPRNGGGYSLPPTSLLQTQHADKLYVVSRTITVLRGTRDTCDSEKGTATVTAFDNHIVGCHISGAGECGASDFQFIDSNRTVYQVGAATYEAKVVADGATCADVRAALPAQ
jgi:hypothetical protein